MNMGFRASPETWVVLYRERFEILSVVLMKGQVFWDVTPYRLYYREDGGTTLFRNISTPSNIPEYSYIFISTTVRTTSCSVIICISHLFPYVFQRLLDGVPLALCIIYTSDEQPFGHEGQINRKNVCEPHYKWSETRLKRHRSMRFLVYSVRYSWVPINFSLLTVTMYSPEQHSFIMAQNIQPFS